MGGPPFLIVTIFVSEELNLLSSSLPLASARSPAWAHGESGRFRFPQLCRVEPPVAWGEGSGGASDRQSADCWLQLCTDSCICVPCTMWLGKWAALSLAWFLPSQEGLSSSAGCGWDLPRPPPPGEASHEMVVTITIHAATKKCLQRH